MLSHGDSGDGRADRLDHRLDFEQHNAEVARLWDAYFAGQAWRVPVVFGIASRYFMFNDAANPAAGPDHATYEQYINDPATMLRCQLQWQDWSRHHILQDVPLGLPAEGWDVAVDFQTYAEAAWFGCQVLYLPGEVPDTVPLLIDDRTKREIFRRPMPGPFEGIMGRNFEFYHWMRRRQEEGYTYRGRPIRSVSPCYLTNDGPFTVACEVRGAAEMCLDLLVDPGFARDLLDLITEAAIRRIRAYREALGEPIKRRSFPLVDDSIQCLSTDMYEEFVLPYHRKLVAAFVDPLAEPGVVASGRDRRLPWRSRPLDYNTIHLCGDASRHFPTIRRELNVKRFDTGYPIDHGAVRHALGPDVEILGGPHVQLVREGPPEAIRAAVRQVLDSGVTEGRRFILREGNNLAPHTPLEHLRVMYEAGREFGQYE